ncbi:MAG: hypothetical protein ACO1NY_04325 [Pseudorhodoplanes sp.]
MSSSLPLMFVYTVVAFALQGLAIGAIMVIEPLIAGWSGAIFMTAYLAAFWLAWIIAVRITEPRAENAIAQPSHA